MESPGMPAARAEIAGNSIAAYNIFFPGGILPAILLSLRNAVYFRIVWRFANFDNQSVFMIKDKKNILSGLACPERLESAPALGDLELDVMELFWERQSATAQDIHAELASRRISLSTVQSTLERLVRKQLLGRTKQGRAYVYHAVVGREQLIGQMIQTVAARLANGRITPMISGFCSFVEENDARKKASGLAALLRRYIDRIKKV
jgi:predicted transcriptional regulator